MATTSTEGLPEGASATATTTPAAAAQPTDTQAAPSAAPAKTEAKPADDDNDEDSEFDELDDVLDDFSKPKPEAAPAQPAPAQSPAPAQDPSTGIAPPDFDEDAFLKQLEQDMANMMGGGAPAAPTADPNVQSTVDQGAEMFAKQLEESGVPPGDFLKQLLADVMAEQGGAGGSGAAAAGASNAKPQSSAPEASSEQPADSFNDAIKRTMGRMKESGDKATAAASNEDDLSDDMIAQLLKAVEAGADGAGEDGDLSKMFMGMMEQLSNKEMLYEPMKELDVKFGPWLEKNKSGGSVPIEDIERFQKQAEIVKQIVTKFEERSYSDDDPKCREYIWERMQEMQAAGSPPEELVSNPLMGDLGGGAAGAGMPDCPQQ
ncbi:Pex19 protein [Penicillium brevicompactum]|uniref:Pex19 protein n=1 Tax=Penicillium brevicompactum TaxID=5074 RepID=UPI002541A6CB|nr:Pex19 protein [Penicillium brevicompactum]KAJ5326956.1 Pex19 protein [Penicillium brevicompactum]